MTRIEHCGSGDLRKNLTSPAVSELLHARSLREPPSRGARALPRHPHDTRSHPFASPINYLAVSAPAAIRKHVCIRSNTDTYGNVSGVSALAATLLRPSRLDDAS